MELGIFMYAISVSMPEALNQTVKKLAMSFDEYVLDRVSDAFKLLSMADLITRKVQVLQI